MWNSSFMKVTVEMKVIADAHLQWNAFPLHCRNVVDAVISWKLYCRAIVDIGCQQNPQVARNYDTPQNHLSCRFDLKINATP